MNSLQNKIALITGATSGIGASSAIRFAQAGATVIITGRSEVRGNMVLNEICSSGGKALFQILDVDDDMSIEKCAAFVKEKFGKIDILFNNAGVFPVVPPIENIDRESTNAILNTNTSSVMMMIKYFLPLINEGGTILNNASVAGIHSFVSGQSYAYNASKSALVKLTLLLAKRYGSYIRVNAIAPGFIHTPLYKTFNEDSFKDRIPMRRAGLPEEVAATANYLVSDDASYINGVVIEIDGGLSL